jgi:hypothetical protein
MMSNQPKNNGYSSAILWSSLGAITAPEDKKLERGILWFLASPLLDNLYLELEKQYTETSCPSTGKGSV